MKPLVDPSAYSEQMSPMCRKLDILSDMFGTQGGKPAERETEECGLQTMAETPSDSPSDSVVMTFEATFEIDLKILASE